MGIGARVAAARRVGRYGRCSWNAATAGIKRRLRQGRFSRLEFCTFRDLANPNIGGHCGASVEFCRVSVQSRVVKNEAAISALLKRYITLITHLAALRPIFIFRWSSSDPLCATQKVQNSSLGYAQTIGVMVSYDVVGDQPEERG
jgi:hypothetical protein